MTNKTTNSFIQVNDIVLRFKKDILLDHVSYQCEHGKIHGIVGRNGSGKTLLMKCICGFIRPNEGHIYVRDKEIGKDIDFTPDTGIIIETPGFIPYYSGYRNLKVLAAINNRISRKDIENAMYQVGLDPTMKKRVATYSLGMRQRLGIAQAIMEDPSLIILDEPFNGLDKHGVEEMREYFLSLKKKGKTILLTSHNTEDIEYLCDTVVEMDHGKFI
ncbi:MAG: ABC transporter ATP-binding protein [Clostridium sp.]|jgi:ABC-type multidrug transport system, ATPase component|uniref:ABC transporter ATP-binding protein n=1 Tax=Butyribacter sp. TaxID=2822465 RepID=UPI002EC44E1A|nr:ATP-binding cassette domain-containing protein [Lachnospiraceae bacterium]